MKINIKTIIIASLVLLCTILSLQMSKVGDRNENLKEILLEYQHQYEHLKSVSDNKAILSKMQYYIEGDTLDNVEVEKWNFETKLRLVELLVNKPRLFFYISEGGCTSCYLSYLKRLSSLVQECGTGKIFILAHFTDKKTLEYLLFNNHIEIDIYTIQNPLNLFPKDNSYPVLFLLSKDLCVGNAFVADKANFDLVDAYLEVVKYRYLEAD